MRVTAHSYSRAEAYLRIIHFVRTKNFPKNLHFLRSIGFTANFAYVLNEWILRTLANIYYGTFHKNNLRILTDNYFRTKFHEILLAGSSSQKFRKILQERPCQKLFLIKLLASSLKLKLILLEIIWLKVFSAEVATLKYSWGIPSKGFI